MKAFYLANADVKQVLNSIRSVIKTRDIIFDERLNVLVMRDTPEAVRAAEKLVALQDQAEPEVVLQLEVMEVSTSRLQELGIRFPEQISAGVVGAANTPGTITLPEYLNRNASLVRLTISNPALIVNLRKLDSDTNLLANPHVRVRNREKARIHIGERVPVITTISTANVGVSESVSYLDVGLKLELEPNIYLDDDVAMKVGLEVSNIIDTITRTSGTQVYRLGTRNASTTLRLKDGETQILAGLIQNDERRATNKGPRPIGSSRHRALVFQPQRQQYQDGNRAAHHAENSEEHRAPAGRHCRVCVRYRGQYGRRLGRRRRAGPVCTRRDRTDVVTAAHTDPGPAPAPATPPAGPSFPAPGMPGAPGGPPPIFPPQTTAPSRWRTADHAGRSATVTSLIACRLQERRMAARVRERATGSLSSNWSSPSRSWPSYRRRSCRWYR